MSTKMLPVSLLLLLLGSLLVCGVQVSDASAEYTVTVTSENDVMGTAYTPSSHFWGRDQCDIYDRDFAPPRNEVARAAFAAATAVEGWAGLKYNASGDAPKYYVSGGRFKDCLYAGYPFGDMTPYWVDSVVTQAEGSVRWQNRTLSVLGSDRLNDTHCLTSICTNNDDCFGNGVSVSGNWPSCSCGGCVSGVTGTNCNNFTIDNATHVIPQNLTYDSMVNMRSVCEASGMSLFSHTTDKAGWDLLQTRIPSTFRFYVDLTDAVTASTWRNTNGVTISVGSNFSGDYYGEWASGEGTNTTGGQCVDMMGGKLYQTDCKGNRHFICVDTPAATTTTTTTTPTTTTTTTTPTTTSNTTAANNTSSNTTTASPLHNNGFEINSSVIGLIVTIVVGLVSLTL